MAQGPTAARQFIRARATCNLHRTLYSNWETRMLRLPLARVWAACCIANAHTRTSPYEGSTDICLMQFYTRVPFASSRPLTAYAPRRMEMPRWMPLRRAGAQRIRSRILEDKGHIVYLAFVHVEFDEKILKKEEVVDGEVMFLIEVLMLDTRPEKSYKQKKVRPLFFNFLFVNFCFASLFVNFCFRSVLCNFCFRSVLGNVCFAEFWFGTALVATLVSLGVGVPVLAWGWG